MMILQAVVVFTTLGTSVLASSLLPYLTPCPQTHPDINTCLLKSAKTAFPYYVAGDEKHRIPIIDPFTMERMEFVANTGVSNIKIVNTDIVVQGYRNLNITDASIDLQNKIIFFSLYVPEVNGSSNYEVKGSLLTLPIDGNGKVITYARDLRINITAYYDLETKSFNNQPEKRYFVVKDMDFDISFNDFDMQFGDLFVGNQALSGVVSTFIKQNFEFIREQMKPYSDDLTKQFIGAEFDKIQEFFPYDEMFPEK